ncbi:phage tail tube protein [Sphingomonas sp. CFBP 13706]|uniref:phage tail tube protein n=1 Tax=Sphingomonas sp. CFBP 13706 TaxID=2775314 RepID=UPI0017863A2B|nr:hypothetical protein [Sphingomonas sp. CFBP 13706]
MANPSDTTYAIVANTATGTPVAPVFNIIENLNGNDITFDYKTLTSEALKANRDVADMAYTSGSGTGPIALEVSRSVNFETLMLSAISAKPFTANATTAGTTDSAFTYEKTIRHKNTEMHYRYFEQQATKMTLSVATDAYVKATFDTQALDWEYSTSKMTGAEYVIPASGPRLKGEDMGAINIGGLDVDYTSLELVVDQAREVQFALGKRNGIGQSTSANRMVTLTVKAYREDLNPELLFGDAKTETAVSLNLGKAGTGYGYEFPRMLVSVPKHEVSGASELVNLTLTGLYSDVAGFAMRVTKL